MQRISDTRRSTGERDSRACRGSAAQADDDDNDNDRRDDHAMRALVDEMFNEVVCGRKTPNEAGDLLDAAGVPFEVQCRVMCGVTKGVAK